MTSNQVRRKETIDAAALFRKAVEHHRERRFDEALELYDAAIRRDPNVAASHCNRGLVLQSLKRPDEAVRSYDRAIVLNVNFAEAHFNKGNALQELKQPQAALLCYDRAIALNPGYAKAHYNRGNVLLDLERPEAAAQSYDRAIALKPDYAMAYYNRGGALRSLGRLEAALRDYNRAVELRPDHAEAHTNRGGVLERLRRWNEALASYERAIDLNPQSVLAHCNRANALRRLQRFEEALESYDHAIALKPDHAEARNNRGDALRNLKRFNEALESHDRAIALNPDFAAAYWNKGRCKLLMGDFVEGWQLYEWRKKTFKPLGFWACERPEWSGAESIAGKTLYIHAEQALGDTIQFCRYALLAEQRGANVILAVQEPLMRLLDQLGPTIRIVGSSAAPPEFDYHIPLLSLPLAFRTDLNNIPAQTPYLRAEPEKVTEWRSRLGRGDFKVGICWQGGGHGTVDAGRSIPLRHFQALAGIANMRVISLQKGYGTKQLAELRAGMKVEDLGDQFDGGRDAFIDTAAVMECLDLVITSDTAIAHLAGALAKPTWVALKVVPDWRWLLDRSDSPWYPTTRLFRQTSHGDWPGVFAAMNVELAGLVRSAAASHS